MKSSVLNALRKGTDTVLKLFGTEIVLIPHARTKKPGGVYDWDPQPARPPQIFNIEPNASTLSGITGAGGGVTNIEGAAAHTWAYSLTGRHDAAIEIGDTWTKDGTAYRVVSIQPSNLYERVGIVSAIGKDPSYGT